MKGLILKDLINLKRQTKTMIILIIFYFVLALTNENSSMFSGMILILFAMLPTTAISYDERANWDKYGLTMPISRVDMVLSKYILGFILSSIALIICFIVQIFINKSISKETIGITLLLFCISLFYTTIVLPIVFKLGVEKGRMLMTLVLFIPFTIIMLLPKFITTPPTEEMLIKILYASPVIIIVLYILSILLSISIYKKKEF